MDGYFQFLQRPQQALQAIGQPDGRCGIGQQECARDEQHDPQHHEEGRVKAASGDMQKLPLEDHSALAGIEQVQNAGKDQNEDDRLHALEQGFQAHLGHRHAIGQKEHHQTVADKGFGQEQGDDEQHHHHQFGAGIQPVKEGIARKILPQGDLFQHTAPPFPASFSSSAVAASSV